MRYPFAHHKLLQGLTIAFALVALMFVGLAFASLVVNLTLPLLFGISDPSGFVFSQAEQIKNPMATLYMQSLTSSLGFFLFPAVVFYYLFKADIVERAGLLRFPPLKYWLIAIVIMMATGVFSQIPVQLSEAIPLPQKLQSLRSIGKNIDKLLDSFFVLRSPFYFMVLTVVMALLPAICEEVFFRGTIQNILLDFECSPRAAILISGLAFAAIHLEFNNFLAIWCMGIVLGMLYYYTDSLWVSITAHFLNNFMVVAGKYAYMNGSIKSDVLSSDALPLYYTIPAGFIMIGGLILLSKWSLKKVKALPD